MKNIFLMMLFVVCTFLSGCFSNVLAPKEDPTTFYVLSKHQATASVGYDGSVSLNVLVPGYLNRNQITTLSGSETAIISEFNRWIENPANLFARAFADGLSSNMPKASVFLYPEIPCLGTKNCDVRINITDCIGQINGQLIFSGRWIVIKDGKAFAHNFVKKISTNNGYIGYVEAISKCIAEVSADIAKSI